MAEGNRHLGYKEVLNSLEERSPGTKASFLFGFLERGHPRFAGTAEEERDALGACSGCGAPTPEARPGEPTVCAFCRLRERASTTPDATIPDATIPDAITPEAITAVTMPAQPVAVQLQAKP